MPQRGDSWADQEAAFFGAAATSSGPDNGRGFAPDGDRKPAAMPAAGGGIQPDLRQRASALRDTALRAGRTLGREVGDALRQTEAALRDGTRTVPVGGYHPGYGNDRGSSCGGPSSASLPPSSAAPPTSIPSAPSAPNSSGSFINNLTRQISRHASSVIPSCVVCGALAPTHYQFHPFFPDERACAHHGASADQRGGGNTVNATGSSTAVGTTSSGEDLGRCCGCNRFAPLPGTTPASRQFADLHDAGRKLCPACLRTVVTDSDEGRALWFDVLNFLGEVHGLFDDADNAAGAAGAAAGAGARSASAGLSKAAGGVRGAMEQIPVLIVEHSALNDPGVRGSGHGQGHTRGLCVYEYSSAHPLGGQLRDFLGAASMGNVFGGPRAKARITAVLCLRGLPRDLVASVLAHEATHAWFKLHRSYDPHCMDGGLPQMVEEGCCQLVAYLFLRHLEEVADRSSNESTAAATTSGRNGGDNDGRDETDDGPSDARLRQYFRYSIETMTDEIYGKGFRRAAESYSAVRSYSSRGLRVLLDYVAENKGFPPS